MQIVTLAPLTKRGKQLVKQHGDRWEVINKRDTVIFSELPGPFLLVQPITEERAPANDIRSARKESASRWVNQYADENFKVMP